MSLWCHLPPLKMVTSYLTLPPSNSHCDGGLLLYAACTALPVLPPPIFGQPILGIMLFPLYNLVKCNIYGHVWIFLFLKKKKVWIFCVCVRVKLDTFVTKCIQVNIFPVFLKLWICHIILCNVLCSLENFILDKSIHIRTAFQ